MPLDEEALQQIRTLIDERVAPIEIKRVEFEEIKTAMRELQVEVAHLVHSMERGFAEVDRRFAEQGERMERGFAEQGERMERGFAEVDRRFAEQGERIAEQNARMDRGFSGLKKEIGALTLFPRRVHADALARAREAGMLIVPWDYQYRRLT